MIYILNTVSTKHSMLRLDLAFHDTDAIERWVNVHVVAWVSYTVTVLKEASDVEH